MYSLITMSDTSMKTLPSSDLMQQTSQYTNDTLPHQLHEFRLNGLHDWLGHIERSRSPNQAPSEPSLSSLSSLFSAEIVPSFHSLSDTNLGGSAVGSREYRTSHLQGAGIWLFPELPKRYQVVPAYIQARINQVMTDPGVDFPLDIWKEHFTEFREKQSSNPSINESTGATALFNNMGLDTEMMYIHDQKTRSIMRESWTTENRLTNLTNPKSFLLATPAPDLAFGFTTTAFTQFFTGQNAFIYRARCRVGKEVHIYFPYFSAELKSPSTDILAGQHQCMNAGAMGAGILRNLLGNDDPVKRENIVMFTALLDLYTVTFYVTWVTDDMEKAFIVKEFHSLLLNSVEEFIECRKIIHNIHTWALTDHMPMLAAHLNDLELKCSPDGTVTQEDIAARGAAMSGTAAGWVAAAQKAPTSMTTVSETAAQKVDTSSDHATQGASDV
ncbi:hypothetical protein F5Y04DRAFT_251737 [Hypomontagnella monticulosa]|nr:hypothetical protein F5Y04DRAFT_251737 [Hypomontagnella monticulosa]